jgi:hypothetical protein
MAETKTKKVHVKKPPRVKKAKPVQNRCGICEQPCTPEKKVHDGCAHRQQKRAKRTSLKMKQGREKAKTTEIVPEDAQVKAEEKKQAQARIAEIKDEDVVGKEGN